MSASRHVRSLLQAEAIYDADLGSVRRLTVDSFPILKRMSMKRLVMKPGAIREAPGTPTPTSWPAACRARC